MAKKFISLPEARLLEAIFGEEEIKNEFEIRETEKEIADRLRREQEAREERQEMLKNPYWKRNIKHLKRIAEANEVDIIHRNAFLLMEYIDVDGKCPMGLTTIHNCIDLINGN